MADHAVHSVCPDCKTVYSRLRPSSGDDTVKCRECGGRFAFSQHLKATKATASGRTVNSSQPKTPPPLPTSHRPNGRPNPGPADFAEFIDLGRVADKDWPSFAHLETTVQSFLEKSVVSPAQLSFRHPVNGYVETVPKLVWLWVLLFGGLYFASKGVWTHAVVGIVLAFLTFGISWFAYPFFARSIMRDHYLRRGWLEV